MVVRGFASNADDKDRTFGHEILLDGIFHASVNLIHSLLESN